MAERAVIERWLLPPTELLARYHRFEVRGIEHIPETGPLLIVSSHGNLTYDILLGMAAIYRQRNRVVHSLGDRFWFRFPGVSTFMTNVGVVVAGQDGARDLLRRGEIVGVAPGGMWEALRPREERFRLRWDGRRGFARLAVSAGRCRYCRGASAPAGTTAVSTFRSASSTGISPRLVKKSP